MLGAGGGDWGLTVDFVCGASGGQWVLWLMVVGFAAIKATLRVMM